jgi:MFS family permease
MSFTSAGRDVRLVAAAKSVSWLGDSVAMVALTLQLQSDGRGAGGIAALLVANALPMVLLSGLVGRVVDRVDNRMLLVASSLTQALVCTVLAFVSSPAAVLVLVALLGAGQCVNSASWQAMLPAIVGTDGLPRAIGLIQAGTTMAGIAAPALGGLLTGLYGARVPLLIDAATFLAVLSAALLLHTRRTVVARAAGEKQQGGLAIVWRDPLLRPLFVLLALFVLIGSMVNVVEVFLVRETLHASTTWYGISGAAFSLGALTGAVLSSRLSGTVTLARGFVAAAALLAVGLVGLGCAPSILWLLPIGFVTGAGNGVLNVTLSSLVMGRARSAEQGRVGALLGGVASGTQLAAFAVAGVLAAHLSPRTLFVLAGGLGLLAPALFGRRVVRAAAQANQADSAVMTPSPTPSPVSV